MTKPLSKWRKAGKPAPKKWIDWLVQAEFEDDARPVIDELLTQMEDFVVRPNPEFGTHYDHGFLIWTDGVEKDEFWLPTGVFPTAVLRDWIDKHTEHSTNWMKKTFGYDDGVEPRLRCGRCWMGYCKGYEAGRWEIPCVVCKATQWQVMPLWGYQYNHFVNVVNGRREMPSPAIQKELNQRHNERIRQNRERHEQEEAEQGTKW